MLYKLIYSSSSSKLTVLLANDYPSGVVVGTLMIEHLAALANTMTGK